jgi:hypothetical protein
MYLLYLYCLCKTTSQSDLATRDVTILHYTSARHPKQDDNDQSLLNMFVQPASSLSKLDTVTENEKIIRAMQENPPTIVKNC